VVEYGRGCHEIDGTVALREVAALVVLVTPFIVLGSFFFWSRARRQLPDAVTEYLRTVPPTKSSSHSWLPGPPRTVTHHRVRCELENGRIVDDVVVRDGELVVPRLRYLMLQATKVRAVHPAEPVAR
jgi:hypothetical protein